MIGTDLASRNWQVIKEEEEMPWWQRFLLRIPLLSKSCPFEGRHFFWERVCVCGIMEPDPENEWHGGVYDMKADMELHVCTACIPEMGHASHQWCLSPEEEHLLFSWRLYRQEALSHYEKDKPFVYKVFVELNGGPCDILMTRTQGAAILAGSKELDEEEPAKSKPN